MERPIEEEISHEEVPIASSEGRDYRDYPVHEAKSEGRDYRKELEAREYRDHPQEGRDYRKELEAREYRQDYPSSSKDYHRSDVEYDRDYDRDYPPVKDYNLPGSSREDRGGEYSRRSSRERAAVAEDYYYEERDRRDRRPDRDRELSANRDRYQRYYD